MFHDLRLAFRKLRQAPGFTILVVLTLALGIGATTAVFSVTDALLLRPLPYPHAERLVMVWDQLEKIGVRDLGLSANTYDAYRSLNIFEGAAAFREDDETLVLPDRVDRVAVLLLGGGLQEMAGAHLARGRGFQPEDWLPEHNDVALLSNRLSSRIAAPPGSTIHLANRAYTVIGILAPDATFGLRAGGADVWVPLPPADDRGRSQFRMLARLRPGISLEAAQTAVTTAARLFDAAQHPYRGPNGEDAGYRAAVVPLREQLFGNQRTGTSILLGAVGLLLLVACVNVANLLLARAAGREHEIAVRRALGASRWRLVRQSFAEAAVLAAVGGAGGLLASVAGVEVLSRLNPARLPGFAVPSVDGRALAFTAAVSLAVSLLFGMAPAISVARVNWGARGTRPKRLAPAALIAIETALALVLLVGAGLLLESFLKLERVDPGFQTRHVLTMRLELSGPRYHDPRHRAAFLSQLRESLAALPGAVSASAISRLPVAPFGDSAARSGNPFSIEGRAWDPSGAVPQIAHTQTIEIDYFGTLGIPLRAGRDFNASDTASTMPVTIVGETLARRWFPAGAIGKRILLGAPHPGASWMTIVGIAADVKTGALDQPAMPQFYTPAAQDPPFSATIVLRSAAAPAAIARQAAAAVRRLDAELPVFDVSTIEERIARSIGQPRYQGSLAGFFALAALLLAAVGVYGVVAQDTARRKKDNAIRIALGAGAGRIMGTELARGLRPVLAGAAAGACGAALTTRLLTRELFGITPLDPTAFLAAVALLASAAACACLIPARRSARQNPAGILRAD